MRKSYKYRLYPSKSQLASLQASLDACRWVYNSTLAAKKQAYDENNISLSKYDLSKFLPEWKEAKPELKLAHSQALQNAQERVDLAYKAFFRRVKAGEKPGYPRFKGYDRYDSFTLPQNPPQPKEGLVKLPKVGKVKVKLHRPIKGNPKRATIIRSATGKWYICYSCEDVPIKPIKHKKDKAVGVDLGCTTFAVLSDGSKIASPKFMGKDLNKLAKASRKHSNRKEAKTKGALAMAHERIANKRRDFAHKESRKLVDKYSHVFLEDLNIASMLEQNEFKTLNRAIADSSWRMFINCTLYKAEEAGTVVKLVDPRNTTKTCSRCGTIMPKALSERVHNCSFCGLKLDRDLNAAFNILALGQQSLVGSGQPRSPRL